MKRECEKSKITRLKKGNVVVKVKKKRTDKKTSWPTKAAMQQVYEQRLWGTNGDEFYSGEGSHDESLVATYIEGISAFLKSFKEPITICDLGCGDFNIGRQFVPFVGTYLAVDIVPELIAHNSTTFDAPNLEFLCLDIAKDDLPKADCAILRQVLQHLSNAEVAAVVNKLHCFKYVILTEHVPEGEYVPNLDIISGQGIRLKKQSGINLLNPPFSMEVKKKEMLLSQHSVNHPGVIITTLFQMF